MSPAGVTATLCGLSNSARRAGPPSPPWPLAPVPATTVRRPARSNSRTRWPVISTKYMFPARSNPTPNGELSRASVGASGLLVFVSEPPPATNVTLSAAVEAAPQSDNPMRQVKAKLVGIKRCLFRLPTAVEQDKVAAIMNPDEPVPDPSAPASPPPSSQRSGLQDATTEYTP